MNTDGERTGDGTSRIILLSKATSIEISDAMDNREHDLDDEKCDSTWKVKARTVWAFGAIGFLVDFCFYINISASQDILEATTIPTSVVLLSIVGPACLVTVLCPYIAHRVSVLVHCCVIFTVAVTGSLITSFVDDPRVKIFGVCLVSFGFGNLDAVFVPLTSFYGPSTVNSFALGSGISYMVAPLLYIGLTMLVCLSPQVSLLIISALWILLPISYFAMEDPRNISHPDPRPTSYKEIPYSPVGSDPSSSTLESGGFSSSEMLSLVWQTQPFFIGLFVNVFCRQLLISGVVTTIAYPNVIFTPRNQYLLYVFASGVGEFLGYLSHCGLDDKFTIKKPFFLAVLNVLILILMVFDSWFRFSFLSNFYAGASLVLLSALLEGIYFVSSFQVVGEGLGVAERRFCRAFLIGAMWTADFAVALIGLIVENQLREHCVNSFDVITCFTRSPTAWDSSVSCML